MTLHWPQIVWLCLSAFVVLTAPIVHGMPRKPINGFQSIASIIVSAWLLWCGGFFGP